MLSLVANVPNNSHNSELDQSFAQFRDQTRFWIQRVAVPIILVIGVFGNLITVIIMTRRRMRSTTNMYLAALAFVDMLYLLLTFLLGLSHYPNMADTKYYVYWRIRPFLMMLTDACSNTSVWLIVTFTIERYIAVKYPMKGKVWCTEERAKKLIIGVVLFGLMFASPVPFEWKVIERQIPNKDPKTIEAYRRAELPADQQQSSTAPAREETFRGESAIMSTSAPQPDDGFTQPRSGGTNKNRILALDYSDFGRNETYKTIYYWSTAAIFYFIPLLSLALVNSFLVISVHQSRKERNKMTTHKGASKSVITASISNTPIIAIDKNNPPEVATVKASSVLLRPETAETAAKPQAHQILRMPSSTGANDDGPGINKSTSVSNDLPPLTDRSHQVEAHHNRRDPKTNSVIANNESRPVRPDNLEDVHCQIDCSSSSKSIRQQQEGYSSRKEPIFEQVGRLDRADKEDSKSKTTASPQKVSRESLRTLLCDTDITSGGSGALAGAKESASRSGETHRTCVAEDTRTSNNNKNNNSNNNNSNKNENENKSGNQFGASDGAIGRDSISMIDGRTGLSVRDRDVVHRVDRPREERKIYGFKQADVQNSCDKTMEQIEEQLVSDALVTTDAVNSTAGKGTERKCSNIGASLATPSPTSPPPTSERDRYHNYKNSNAQNTSRHEERESSLSLCVPNKTSSQASLRTRSQSSSIRSSAATTTTYGGPVSNQERRITIMLIAVVILFLVCQIPSAAMLIYTAIHEPVPNTNEHALVLAFGNIFNFLMAVNAAGNFILYSFLSEKYRKTFVLLFCNCYRRNMTHDSFGQGTKRHASIRFVPTPGMPHKGATEASSGNSAAI